MRRTQWAERWRAVRRLRCRQTSLIEWGSAQWETPPCWECRGALLRCAESASPLPPPAGQYWGSCKRPKMSFKVNLTGNVSARRAFGLPAPWKVLLMLFPHILRSVLVAELNLSWSSPLFYHNHSEPSKLLSKDLWRTYELTKMMYLNDRRHCFTRCQQDCLSGVSYLSVVLP